MNAATLTPAPLCWPIAPSPRAAQRRWAHHLVHALAIDLDMAAAAHDQLTALLADPEPWPPGQLAARLRAVAHAAVTATDTAHLHTLLRGHRLHDVAAHLRRAQHHRVDALQILRRLADLDQSGLLDAAAAAALFTPPCTTCTTAPSPSSRPTTTCSPPSPTSHKPRR